MGQGTRSEPQWGKAPGASRNGQAPGASRNGQAAWSEPQRASRLERAATGKPPGASRKEPAVMDKWDVSALRSITVPKG